MGGYALFTFATGAPEHWPESATEAWAKLEGRNTPLRVVRIEDRARPQPRRERAASVSVIRGPIETSEAMLEPGATRACTLRIEAGARRLRLALDEAALGRGVLLGRYSRCDSAHVFADDDISRVHVLVVRVEDDIVAIDTASTNGVYTSPSDDDPTRVVRLSSGEVAHLGDGLGVVRLG